MAFRCAHQHFYFHQNTTSSIYFPIYRLVSTPATLFASISNMPWLGLSRRTSQEESTMQSMSPSSPHRLSSNSSVMFIPSMMDGSCGTSPTMQKMSSMQMIMMDMKVMAQNMICIPEMIRSLMNTDTMQKMCSSWMNIRDMGLQIMLYIIEMCMMVMIIPCFLAMPGMAFLCICCVCVCTIMILCWPMNGDQVVRCMADGMPSENQDKFTDERWVYINSAMTRYDICKI